MRSLSVEVEFATSSPREIPRIGQRKRLLVNGHHETLWCNGLEIERAYDHRRSIDAPGDRTYYQYVGVATYGPYELSGSDPTLS